VPAFNAQLVAQIVGQPNPYRGEVCLWNRLDIAKHAGRKKTTHTINTIENAVLLGYVYKYWGHDGVRQAWIYTLQPPMF